MCTSLQVWQWIHNALHFITKQKCRNTHPGSCSRMWMKCRGFLKCSSMWNREVWCSDPWPRVVVTYAAFPVESKVISLKKDEMGGYHVAQRVKICSPLPAPLAIFRFISCTVLSRALVKLILNHPKPVSSNPFPWRSRYIVGGLTINSSFLTVTLSLSLLGSLSLFTLVPFRKWEMVFDVYVLFPSG